MIAATGNGIFRTDYTQAAKGAQAKGHSNQAKGHSNQAKGHSNQAEQQSNQAEQQSNQAEQQSNQAKGRSNQQAREDDWPAARAAAAARGQPVGRYRCRPL